MPALAYLSQAEPLPSRRCNLLTTLKYYSILLTTLITLFRPWNFFGEASGQVLHKAKTKLLPVGAPPPTCLPPNIAGLSVVNEATALGITFRSGTQPPTTDWDAHLQRVDNCLKRARSLRLTAMGRGLASATYGVGQLLYHAEFLDLPEVSRTCKLTWLTHARFTMQHTQSKIEAC